MSTFRVGRVTVHSDYRWPSVVRIVQAFLGPEPRAQLHLHDWEYFVDIDPPPAPQDLRTCRMCGAREGRIVPGDPWLRNRAAEYGDAS